MKIGIVGNEASKFTRLGEVRAKEYIISLVQADRDGPKADAVISGACHLGGIDIWAVELAKELGIKATEFPPKSQNWAHYKKRNIQIAETSDMVVSVAVDVLPVDYTGMKFKLCYHCGTSDHVKSGGCWTAKYALKLNKPGWTYVIQNY